jgi:hypothetical protein
MRCIATLSDFCKTFGIVRYRSHQWLLLVGRTRHNIDETDRSHLLLEASNGPGLTITVPFMLVS